MGKELPGDDDPRRSIELLWGQHEPGRRGPKPRFSTADVVQAAIAIADRDGLAAISMRAVAQSVGVSPMSLYTYVRSKTELLALMFDQVMGEMQDPPPDLEWRAALTFMARERWRLGLHRPWLLDVAHHRLPLGPNLVARLEGVIRTLDATGLPELDKDLVAGVIVNYVRGALHELREAREAEERSGLTDEQWFSLVEPALQTRLDPARRPTLARLRETWRKARGRANDPTVRFEQGLEVVLDGIEAFIARRRSEA